MKNIFSAREIYIALLYPVAIFISWLLTWKNQFTFYSTFRTLEKQISGWNPKLEYFLEYSRNSQFEKQTVDGLPIFPLFFIIIVLVKRLETTKIDFISHSFIHKKGWSQNKNVSKCLNRQMDEFYESISEKN